MTKGGGSIEFSGSLGEGLGIAMWQADGTGPEPAAVGHSYTTPIDVITAHYYIASRDYVDPTARGAVAAGALAGSWPHVRAALKKHERLASELVMRLPLTTPGADREGLDWVYRDDVETRSLYPQGPMSLYLGEDVLLEFPTRRLVLTENYHGAQNFSDVRLAIVSDPVAGRVAAGIAIGAASDIAAALLDDLAGRQVRFIVESIVFMAQTFDGQGRTYGRYAEIPAARMEVV